MHLALPSPTLLLCAACVWAASCTPDEPPGLRYDPMFGTMAGVPWHAGQASVRAELNRGIVVRIYEQGTPGEPCSLPATLGRRVELTLPVLLQGSFDASQNPGYNVEAWDGVDGQRDPQALLAIDQAAYEPGQQVLGRARFGSSLAGDVIEGGFTAQVCEKLK